MNGTVEGLVERLRIRAWKTRFKVDQEHFSASADRIEQLEAQLVASREALRPFAESIVIDPTKQRGERHWATCGKLTTFDDQLRAHEVYAALTIGVGD